MNKSGPIIIIEDDPDDQELLNKIFKKLSCDNEILFFGDGDAALAYINRIDAKPFIILSDINLPKLNGIQLRHKLKTDADLNVKCIPYLFFTTALNQKVVIEAYSLSVQGFFVKPHTIPELENVIRTIVDYWKLCAAPNDF